LVKINQCFLFS
jgi:hypothetical protein